MAKSTGGTAARIRAKNQEMAARMKADRVVRTTQRCPVCSGIVSCESWTSRYSHFCR